MVNKIISPLISPLLASVSRNVQDGVGAVRSLTWREIRDMLRFAGRRLREESLPQVAGSLTFTTVFALVPLVTIGLAIFTTFPTFTVLRKALEAYFVQNVMPKQIATPILNNVTMFASKATRLSAVGAVALVFTSVAMMGTIEKVFNRIWRVKAERSWTRRILVYWALLTLGPVLVGVSLSMSTQVYMATSDLVGDVPVLGAILYTLLSLTATTAGFTLMYTVVPNRQVDWRDALWGGLLAALFFELAKRGFAVFITQFPTYSRIYGALAALPLFLIWIYLSWLITLIGALFVAALPVVKYERWWHEAPPGGEFVDAMAILKVLYAASRYGDTALVSTAAVRSCTRIGFDEMALLLERMAAQGWVGKVKCEAPPRVQWGKRVSEGADNWVLLANAERLTLADVYRVFVFGGMAVNAGVAADSDDEADRIAAEEAAQLARHVETAVEQGLQVTLVEHFEGEAAG
jgi:membrane protein